MGGRKKKKTEGQGDWRGEERRGGVKLSGAAGRRRGEGMKWRAGGAPGEGRR